MRISIAFSSFIAALAVALPAAAQEHAVQLGEGFAQLRHRAVYGAITDYPALPHLCN